MGTRRRQLRLATTSRHSDLDKLLGRFDSQLSYHRYLLVTEAFRSSVEGELEKAARWLGANPQPLLVLNEVRADCYDLGLTQTLRMAAIRPISRTDQWLGAQYVLEGSSLGARVLFAKARQLGLSGEFGARHLAKQVGDPERWSCFLTALELAEPFDLDVAISVAQHVFDVVIEVAEAYHG